MRKYENCVKAESETYKTQKLTYIYWGFPSFNLWILSK